MPSRRHRRALIETFESRILYSADPTPTGLAAVAVAGIQQHLDDGGTAAQGCSVELAFIDSRLPDVQVLVEDLAAQQRAGRAIEVILVGADEDGISIISEALAGRSDVSAVHVVGHGSDGVATLGAARLDAGMLFLRAGEIAAWGDALTSGADFLLYGCDVAANGEGQSLVDALAQLTGADVAASTDTTGSVLLGGDWDLEYVTGRVDAMPFVSATLQASWNGVLSLSTQGAETRVNTTTSGGQSTLDGAHSVAMADNGNYVVVWQDGSGVDGSGIGIYAQRYDASGTALGVQFKVNSQTSGDQQWPEVAMDSAGNFVVVWQSQGQDSSNLGVYAQRYNASGVAQGAEFRVNVTTLDNQGAAAVAMDDAGNFVVTWTSWNQDAANTFGIYARRYAADGTVLSGEFLVNTYTAADQDVPAIGMDSTGNFVIAWASNGQDGSDRGIYAKRFNASGVVQGSGEFLVSTTTANAQDFPSVAMDTSGFVLVWEDAAKDGSGNGVFGQRFNSSGSRLGSEFQVNTTTANAQENAVVTSTGAGGFMVTWNSNLQDGALHGVYLRQYDSSGLALTPETRISTTTAGEQLFPSVASDASGRVVAVWSGNGTGDTDGVFMQRYLYKASPVITLSGTNGNYIENAAAVYDASATLTDADTTVFANGQLLYQITANGTVSDELGIRNEGSGAGQIGLSGTSVTYGGVIIGTYSGSFGNGSTPLTVTFNSSATLGAVQALVRNITYRNISENPGTTSRTISLSVSDGTGETSTPVIVTMVLTAVNDAPVIGSNGGGPSAVISVAENTTAVTTATSTDVDGVTTLYSISGTDAASFSINSSSGALSFVSAPNFEAPADAGGNNVYDLTLTVSDGAEGFDTQALAVTVTNVNEAPVLTFISGDVNYAENAGPVVVSASASVSDVDSPDFSGGRMVVSFSANGQAEDRIALANQGTGAGQVGLSGSNVTYGGTLVGTWSGGVGGTPLIVTFNANATQAVVQAVGRDITYENVSDNPSTLVRTMTGFVEDGDGGTSSVVSGTLTIVPSNDAPVITSNSGGASASISITENRTELITVTATDSDSAGLNYSISGGVDAARFTINPGTGMLSFAVPADFENPADVGANNVYDLIVQVNDGNLTDTQSIAVTVTNVASELVVTTTADTVNTGDGTSFSIADLIASNGGTDGLISLREAIVAANNTPGADTITFNIGTGTQTINVLSALPQINSIISIDGTSQTGYAGTPLIVLNGMSAGAATPGLELISGSALSTVRGLVINNFDSSAIQILNTSNVAVVGNYLGTNQTGTTAAGNQVGVFISNASNNVIGGNLAADRNVISGNTVDGVQILGTGSMNNWVGGNYIGLDASGTVDIGNTNQGVAIFGGASSNTVGGTTVGTRNVISGNNGAGVRISDAATSANRVEGNFIGTNAVGTGAIGNSLQGVEIYGAVNNTIGGSVAGTGNLISGNLSDGILISFAADGNVIQGNTIGLNAAGSTVLANGQEGIQVWEGSINTMIGGATSQTRNIIAGNGLQGIVVFGTATGTVMISNTIYGNGALGIDLGGDGVTSNDPGDVDTGANSLQNTPVLTSAQTTGSSITIDGTLNSLIDTHFRVEFFASPTSDPSGYGEGQIYIGFVDVLTNGSGNASFNSNYAVAVPGDYVVTATATRLSAGMVFIETSEFSANIHTNPPAISSNGGGADSAVSVAENSNLVTTVTATDPDAAQTLTYSISGGSDMASFAIDPSSGVLTFVTVPDYEAPSDTGANNVYDVIVQVADGAGASDSQAIAVTVTNINDAPALSFLSGAISYTENAPPLVLAPAATISDLDSPDFSGGQLVVSVSLNGQAEDRIAIRNEGGGAGQIGISGSNVTYGGVVIGTWSGGSTGSVPLIVSFNASATPDIAQVLARNITYENLSDTPSALTRTISAHLQDGDGSTSATVSGQLTISVANDAPVISSDGGGVTASVSVAETDVTVTTVTASDADLPADTLSYSLVGGADVTRFTIDPDTGALSFLTAPDFEVPQDEGANNVYDVIVQVMDGANSTAIQAITVTVTAVNDNAPVLTSNGGGVMAAVTIAESTTLVTTLTATDADLPGDTLYYSIVGGADAAKFAIDTFSGVLNFALAPDYDLPGDVGGDNIYDVIVRVDDGTYAVNQSLAITVSNTNEAPAVTITSTSYTATEQSALVLGGTGLSISDADAGSNVVSARLNVVSGTLSATAGSSGVTITGSGTASLVFDGTLAQINDFLAGNLGASLTYLIDIDTPPASDTLTLAADDLGHTGSGTAASGSKSVLINITAVNDGPANTTPGTQVTLVNTPLVFGVSHGNALSVTDSDAAANPLQISLVATHGTLTLGNTTGLTFVSGDGAADAGMTFTGTQVSINAALEGLSYTPTAAYTGTATISLGTADQGNTGGGVLSDSDTINIQIGASRYQQGLDGYTSMEDTYLDSVTPDSSYGNASTVLVDDGSPVSQGLLRFDGIFGDGVGQIPFGSTINSASLSFYVINQDAADTVSLHTMLTNWTENSTWSTLGAGIQTNGVEAVGTPVATFSAGVSGWNTIGGLDASVQTWANGGANYGWSLLTANPGADSWTFASSEYSTLNLRPYLVITYTPPEAPVITSNGGGASGTVSVPENTTSVTTVTATDADSPQTVLRYSIVGGADSTRFSINETTGVLSFLTAPDFESPLDIGGNNIYDITVQVSDGLLSSTQVLAVSVGAVNDNAPLITIPAAVWITENSTAVATITVSDSDRPAQSFSYSLAGGVDAALFTINTSTGDLRFLSAPNFESPLDAGVDNVYDVTVQVSDSDGSTSTQAIAVTVTSADDSAPVITSPSVVFVAENTTEVMTITANDADQPAQPLSYSLAGGADVARFTIDPVSGILRFVRAPDFGVPADANRDNVYDVIVRVSDGVLTGTQALSVSVENRNEMPQGRDGRVQMLEDGTHTFTLASFGFMDARDTPANNLAAVQIIVGPAKGVLSLGGQVVANGQWVTAGDIAAGLLSYTPAADGTGAAYAALTFRVRDDGGTVGGGSDTETGSHTLVVGVTGVNDVPVGSTDTYRLDEDSVLDVLAPGVLANDPDLDGDMLVAELVSGPTNGTLVLAADGSFRYTPSANWSGTESFSYRPFDGIVYGDTTQVILVVEAVNDAPEVIHASFKVPGGGVVVLNADMMIASDVDSLPTSIHFQVDKVDNGHFELVSAPGQAIRQFSYAELAAGRVSFVHAGFSDLPVIVVHADDGLTAGRAVSASLSFAPTASQPSLTPIVIVESPPSTPQAAQLIVPAEPASSSPALVKPVVAQKTVVPLTSVGMQESRAVQDAETGGGMMPTLNVDMSSNDRPEVRRQEAGGLVRFAQAQIKLTLGASPEGPLMAFLLTGGDAAAGTASAASRSFDSTPKLPPLDDGAYADVQVVLQAAQLTGVALSVGAVWWASRAGGLVASLLMAAPAWRTFDPLPVLGPEDEDERDWGEDMDEETARDEQGAADLLDEAREGMHS